MALGLTSKMFPLTSSMSEENYIAIIVLCIHWCYNPTDTILVETLSYLDDWKDNPFTFLWGSPVMFNMWLIGRFRLVMPYLFPSIDPIISSFYLVLTSGHLWMIGQTSFKKIRQVIFIGPFHLGSTISLRARLPSHTPWSLTFLLNDHAIRQWNPFI